MPAPRVIAMLPCGDIEEIAAFFKPLGFHITHSQHRPSPYLALSGHGFDLHYYEVEGHDPQTSHSACGVVVADTRPIWESLAEGLRTSYGMLPETGQPRITRPRAGAAPEALSGFSLIDPAGNWIRFLRDETA